jgi:methionine-rich copper-binding protein CopC
MRKTLLALFFALLATAIITPTAAYAHAGLVSANPAANSKVNVMPREISLTFTEDLMVLGDKEVNTLGLNLMDGPEVPLTDVKVAGAVLTATIPAGDYEAGTYEIFYKIVSADGHKLSDSYSFSLNAPLIAPAPAVDHKEHEGFFHIHQAHIAEVGIALILIVLWIGYRRFNREQGR